MDLKDLMERKRIDLAADFVELFRIDRLINEEEERLNAGVEHLPTSRTKIDVMISQLQ